MVGTAYSNFWNDSYSLLVAKPSARKRLHRFALNTRSMRKQKELMLTLNGAAAGSAAADSYSRVQHARANGYAGQGAANGGGLVSIETVTIVAANTAAADKTDIDTMLTTEGKSQVATYPTDASGNGGGGKLSHVQS